MEKEIRFKIIELPTHQVMTSKDFDEDDSSPTVRFTFFHDGMKASPAFGYELENERDKAFEVADASVAQGVVDMVLEMFNEEG